MLATTKLAAGIRGVPGVLLMETVTMISTAPDHSPAGAFPPPPHLLTIIIIIMIMILTGEHGLAMISIVTTEEDSEDRTIRLC